MKITLTALAVAAAFGTALAAAPAAAAPINAHLALSNGKAQIQLVRQQPHWQRRHVKRPHRHAQRRYFHGVPWAHNHWRYGHCTPIARGVYICWN